MASQDYSALYNRTVDKHILIAFQKWPSIVPDIFHVESTKRRYVIQQGWTGYGQPIPRLPGEPIRQGSISENFNVKFTVGSVGLGDAIPIEDVDDDPTGILVQGAAKIAGGLAESFMDYVEMDITQSYLLNGFTATAGQPDGKSLFSATHLRSRTNQTTTDSNRPSTGVDLTVSSAQSAITALRTQKAPNGRPMMNSPRVLWYNPILDWNANHVFKQSLDPGTANHDDSIINRKHPGVKLVETPWLQSSGTDSAAWGLIGQEHFLYFYWRTKPRTHNDFDATTKSYLTMVDMRYARGNSDWRGTYASPGP